ncbi:hypothetical protein ACYOEI_15740 [Singulisphaera rosea]
MRLHIFSSLLTTQGLDLMSDEESVLRKHSRADAVYEEPIRLHGDSAAYCDGEWVILDHIDPGAVELGRGSTEAEAWTNAARSLVPTPSAAVEAA